MPTLLLPHVLRSARAVPTGPRTALIVRSAGPATAARARRAWAWALAQWRHAVELGLAMLAVTFVLGRFPLPGLLDFGYRSCARGVALLFVGGVVARAPGLAPSRSRIGFGLLAVTLAASASVALADGRTAAVGALWTALGLFHAVRAVAAEDRARRRLVHGLGLLCTAVLVHELWHQPALLWLREERRHALVTEHPNTLGFALALLLPVLLAATARRRMRAAACQYASAASAVLL
ncbi:hypothetical protein K2Z84_07015, partial [Candidatus Binatia bacterium]|nr:hypothetical protein [Candidatus Binatia bacterium]